MRWGKRPPNLVLHETRACVYFRLTRGRIGVVSQADRAVLVDRWGVTNNYVARKVNGKTIYLHRVLLKPRGAKEVDHKNGDKLDNRRSNLRVVTVAQQAQNKGVSRVSKTGYRGVLAHKDGSYEAVAQHYGVVLRQSGIPTLKAAHAVVKLFRHQLFTHHVESRSYPSSFGRGRQRPAPASVVCTRPTS